LLFRFNPRLAAKAAKRHRIKRAGLGHQGTKAQLRAIADKAAATHTIKRLPQGQRSV
jgi:hypothetical protein